MIRLLFSILLITIFVFPTDQFKTNIEAQPVKEKEKSTVKLKSSAAKTVITDNKDDKADITNVQVGFLKDWPNQNTVNAIGAQISGIDVDKSGNTFVFHRGERMWENSDFYQNKYIKAEEGPIEAKTILQIDKDDSNAKVISAFGENLFYLPHGLTVDNLDNVWVTDVALHQVMRFRKGSHHPDLVLGEAFVPGNDKAHFCMPTHVAVAENGDFFVSDGYCNSRIVKFDKNGTFLKQWGVAAPSDVVSDSEEASHGNDYELSIPHSITLIEDQDAVCVADRENRRVQCFTAGVKTAKVAGKFLYSINAARFGRIYSLDYNSVHNMLFILGESSDSARSMSSTVYVFSLENLQFVKEFVLPYSIGVSGHTIASCPRGDCFVAGGLVSSRLLAVENANFFNYQNIWKFLVKA